MGILLEIAANSIASCRAAVAGGADRIELFENLPEGGCTPSYGMLQVVKNTIDIPVYVMIRPRGGDFLYAADELAIMQQDAALCSELGFPGIVFGILDEKGDIDTIKCKEIMQASGDMCFTFHRAFDRCRDMHAGIRQLIALGAERVLTSGGEPDVMKGKEVIKELQKEYGRDIIIMPGCGVTSDNARMITDYCGTKEIHATAKGQVGGNMQFRKAHFTDARSESMTGEISAIKKSLQ